MRYRRTATPFGVTDTSSQQSSLKALIAKGKEQNYLTFAEVNAEQRSGKDAQKVAIGAAIGAGIGQILGKDTKSTVIGAATGAAAGTAVAMGTANYEGCIPQGGRMTISLTAPATIGIAAQ